eukprot:gene10791-11945_t
MQEAYMIVSVLIIIVNSMEMYLLAKSIKTLNPCEQFLLSLSIADLLVGIFTLCTVAVHDERFVTMLGKGSGTDSFVWMFGFVWFSASASVFHISGMTHDRFYAVRKPLKHKVLMTRSRTTKTILCIWLICLALVISFVATKNLHIMRDAYTGQIPFTSVLLIITYSYVIHKTTRYGRNQPNLASSSLHCASQKKKERNLIIMCLMISLSFIALNMPFYVQKTLEHTPKYTLLLLISNSLTNPLVYFFWKYMERRVKKFSEAQRSSRNIRGIDNTAM